MAEAYVEYEVGTVNVELPYDADLIDELKSTIPSEGRAWNPDRKVWVFTPNWWPEARRIIEQYMTVAD